MAFSELYAIWKMLISDPFGISIQTHKANERVGNVPPQQLVGGFSGCATQKNNATEDCVRWLKSMSMSDMAKYSPVEITSTRFLPRNGFSTRYPARNDEGRLAVVWMSC